jgi:DNA-binding MarR family transcriptional regulator
MADVLAFPSPKGKPDRTMIARWGGHANLWSEGWVGVPTCFLRSINELAPFKLTAAEALFILQLMSYKWSADAPYPGYKALAQHMGISPAYAKKLAKSLEDKKLLRRVVRVSQTNRFDLTPLFAKLAAHMSAKAPARRRRKKVSGDSADA